MVDVVLLVEVWVFSWAASALDASEKFMVVLKVVRGCCCCFICCSGVGW